MRPIRSAVKLRMRERTARWNRSRIPIRVSRSHNCLIRESAREVGFSSLRDGNLCSDTPVYDWFRDIPRTHEEKKKNVSRPIAQHPRIHTRHDVARVFHALTHRCHIACISTTISLPCAARNSNNALRISKRQLIRVLKVTKSATIIYPRLLSSRSWVADIRLDHFGQ